MGIIDNKLYKEDLEYISNLELDYNKLKNSTMLITGASGLIGSLIVDEIMYLNNKIDLNCKIIGIGRGIDSAKARFSDYFDSSNFEFISADINEPLNISYSQVDYVLHLASNTHPKAYATDPIGTIKTNVIGLYNMLEFASSHNCKRFLFSSSCEIYGENRGDVEKFDEEYCGYINSNTLRAGYNESKRCGEALCQAYIKQKDMDIVIPRLTRSYGPTMLMTDTKALSQFLKNGLNGEDIVLKSEGNQLFSYTYVVDAVTGILTILLKGQNGEAYNVSDDKCDILLKDLASIIANIAGVKVVFDIPNDAEQQGYSTANIVRLESKKLKSLGWNCKYSVKDGIERNYTILKENN